MPRGLHGEVKVRCWQKERQKLGHLTLLGPMGGVVWGSWVKVRYVNSNQEGQGFAKQHEGLT